MLAFVHKLPCRDDDGVTTKDLSKVRAQRFTAEDLEINELRLISLRGHCHIVELRV